MESVPQQIICPHCAHAQPLPGDVTYLVHALSADEEAAFNATMRWMDANASVDPVE